MGPLLLANWTNNNTGIKIQFNQQQPLHCTYFFFLWIYDELGNCLSPETFKCIAGQIHSVNWVTSHAHVVTQLQIRYHTLKATLPSHFGGSGGIHYFYRGSSDRTPVSIEAPQAWRIHKQSRKTPSSKVFETAQGIRQQVWLLEGLQDRQMTREQQMTHSSCQSWENLKQSENKMQRHQTQNWEANFRNCLQ